MSSEPITSRHDQDAAPLPSHSAVPASRYTFDQLAEIYNQARVDYIVPMPMNGRRMAEYINYYDIDLDASVVALNSDNEEIGVGMLGLRDDRAWITRLGVLPHRRGYKAGQYIMEQMLEQARIRNTRLVQLEVIFGNKPAYSLFRKMGFEDTRELLVIRRPPGKPAESPVCEAATIERIARDDIPTLLETREPGTSWLKENSSLLNTGQLYGLKATLPDGESGWIIYQRAPFQLAHLVFSPGITPAAGEALLYHLHKDHPMQDTKVENLPLDHPSWPIFQKMGYFEAFRRVEMFLWWK